MSNSASCTSGSRDSTRREGELETFALGGSQDLSPDGKIVLHSADHEVRALPLGPSAQGREGLLEDGEPIQEPQTAVAYVEMQGAD